MALALALSGCTGESEPEAGPTSSRTSTLPEPVEGTPTPSPTPEPAEPVDTSNPDLAAYFDKRFTGGDLRLGRVRERQATYTSRNVTFTSEGLTISGVLNVPRGRGPFPAVVLVHGYIDPAVYEQGQGMTRERGYLADEGYIALHVDLRNHAGSDDDPRLFAGFRHGYAVDAINAVNALRDTTDVPVDDDRIALAGRSMGGGVVLQALEMAPGLVGAGVIFSGVSSLEADQWRQYGDGGSGFWSYAERRWGTPDEAPDAYLRASSRPHLGRITEPLLMHHGTLDDSCPPSWARATERAAQQAGVDLRLRWYEGEGHAFGPQFPAAMARTVRFLERELT
jgi:dipeptidyl aminopeptidase/acylaminoacyl peptidase